MAIVKRKLENLKPGKEYILSVRAKNADLNVLSDYSDSIRFQVPTDSTIPSVITGLGLYQSLENIMFVFNYSSDLDISRYEYELYNGNNVSTATKVSSGFNAANVFTVGVDNLQLDSEGSGLVPFWGRVRAIDTTGNVSEWTSLVQTDTRTPVIDNQYIGNLTASKITAGTIGAQMIQLNGANSIIRSTTYTDTTGSKGWQIRGDGHFTFGGPNGITYDNETITIGTAVQVNANLAADSITVGTAPNQLNINDAINSGNGGMTLGDPTFNYWYADGKFRTGNSTNYILWNGTTLTIRGTLQFPDGSTPGTFNNGDLITSGSIGGLTISSSKIYIGTGTWNNANTPFYVDNTGKFSLEDKFSWNPTGNVLNITGTIVASVFKTNDTSGNRIEILPDVASATANADSIRFYSGASGENANNSASIRNEGGTLTISGGALATTGTAQKVTFGSISNGVQFTGSAYSSSYDNINSGFYYRSIGAGTTRPSTAPAVGDIFFTYT